MNKPIGYDEAVAMIPGEGRQIPPGGYIGKIVNATETTSKNGNEMIVLDVDVAEGEYRNFYRDRYEARQTEEQSWGAIVRQVTEGASLPMFKGLATSVEMSNPGFTFPFKPRKITELIGKKIGLVFGREEYINSAGEYKMATRVRNVRSVEAIKKGVEPPKDILLKRDNAQAQTLTLTPVNEELPF
jgi:hypothetical protein